MKKTIREIVNEFLEESKSNLDLAGILEFGSSAYTNKFNDIDLMFISKHKLVPVKDRLKLISIVKKFEKKYPEIVFDFGGMGERERKEKYSITIVFIFQEWLKMKYNPHDLFFIKLLSMSKNIKVLYGRNPFKQIRVSLTKRHLFEMLDRDQLALLRSSLDGEKKKLERARFEFKGFLRAMLIHKGDFKKNDLVKEFRKEYENKIPLPKNSKNIIDNKMGKKDFEDILIFMENCLRFIIK